MIYLGIDPGKSGGMALWEPARRALELVPFTGPKKRGGHFDLEAVRCALAGLVPPTNVTIEEVGPRPGEGSVSAATFARCHGLLLGLVSGLELTAWQGTEIIRPKPQKWKAKVLAGAPRSNAGESQRFHDLTIGTTIVGTLNQHTQDAFFLACYGAMDDGLPLPTVP